MAYDAFKDEDDETDGLKPLGQAPAYSALGPGYAAASAPTAPSSAGGVTGDKFVGFDRYFAANQDTANRTAGEVAGKVGANAEKAVRDIDKAGDAFRKNVEGNTLGATGAQVVVTPQQTQAQQNQATVDAEFGPSLYAATSGTPAKSNRAEVNQNANMGWYGGNSLMETQGYGDLDKNAQAAQMGLDALKTPGGLAATVEDLYGPMSQGSSTMDAALLGQAGGKQFADLNQHYGKLADYLGRAVGASEDTAAWGKREHESNKKRWGNVAAEYDAMDAEAAKPPQAAEVGFIDQLVNEFGGDTAVTDETKPDWGQVSLAGGMGAVGTPGEFFSHDNKGRPAAPPSAHATQFAGLGGTEATWSHMSREEYAAFENMYSEAIKTLPNSAERKRVIDFVARLNAKYGG